MNAEDMKKNSFQIIEDLKSGCDETFIAIK